LGVRDRWIGLHEGFDGEERVPDEKEQETVVVRGMAICNIIVGFLLGKEGIWQELYGEEMGKEEEQTLRRCVFDCEDMVMKEGGGVEGTVKVIDHEKCEGCEKCDDGKRDAGMQTERGFDPLYGYEDKGTQTDLGEGDEKERPDSGVGLEEEIYERVDVARLNIEEREDGEIDDEN
jgi:hypothetical protein